MKRGFLLILFVAGFVTAGFSQFIKQGSIIGNGMMEFKTHKDGDSDVTQSSFGLTPWAGYLVIDNLALGAGISFGSSGTKYDGGKNTFTSFMLVPAARYYLDNRVFGHLQYGFGSETGKNQFGGTTTTTKTSVSELRVGGGYAARITDTVLIEPMVGYLSESNKDKDTNVKNSEGGFFFSIGFTIFFVSTN